MVGNLPSQNISPTPKQAQMEAHLKWIITALIRQPDNAKYENPAILKSLANWFAPNGDSYTDKSVEICVACILPECLIALGGKDWSRDAFIACKSLSDVRM